MKQLFLRATALLLALLLLASAAGCGKTAGSDHSEGSQAQDIVETPSYPFYNPLQEPALIETMAPAVPPEKQDAEKLAAIFAQNADAKGWLRVPNTSIDDVILQGANNNKYLRANNLGGYSFEGCYFVDWRNRLTERGALNKNTIIYGHNLNDDKTNGVRFAQLMRFVDLDFAQGTPYFYVTTPTETMTFKIFASFYSDTKFYYIDTDFKTTAEFTNLVTEAKARSEHIYDVEVGQTDRVMTLSTCTYKFGGLANPNQRFVVMGRLLRVSETDKDPVSITKNPLPKAPVF